MIANGTVLDRALRFIHDHATAGIRVGAVAAHVRASRRWLDAQFVTHLGRTPHEEIVRVQFVQVERLLQDTDLPLCEIAIRAGFRHPEYLSAAFKRRYGVSPSRWRAGQKTAKECQKSHSHPVGGGVVCRVRSTGRLAVERSLNSWR